MAANRRQSEYRSRGKPKWREAIRQKCLTRIKQARQDAIAEKRAGRSATTEPITTNNIAKQILAQEWSMMQSLVPSTTTSSPDAMMDTDDIQSNNVNNAGDMMYDPELLQQVYDELTEELMEAEQKIIQDFDREYEREQAEANHEAESNFQEKDAVVCPMCCKAWLHQHSNVIFCQCGFRVDTLHDGGSLATMKSQLESAVAIHEKKCNAAPRFEMDNAFQMLMMKCSTCDHVAVVL